MSGNVGTSIAAKHARVPRRRHSAFTAAFGLRVAGLVGLTLIAYGSVIYDVALSIGGGSRTAYLMVIPVLLVMIASGCTDPPRGVADHETDWILSALLGGLALFACFLTANRFPTLAGLWHIRLIAAVIWVACAASIIFGVRRVAQMWPLWLFAIATVTPLPYVLMTAALGGTAAASSAVAAVIGAVAVFCAGRRSPLRWRVVAAAAAALVGVGTAAGLATPSLSLSVTISAGLIPLMSFLVLQRFTASEHREPSRDPPHLPRRSLLSFAALGAVAVVQLVLNTSSSSAEAAPGTVAANWTARAGLSASEQFAFIHRYLGPDSTFARYPAPSRTGYPDAAVDVITADNLEALRTYRYVIWYPAKVLPNYRPVDLGNPPVRGALVAATDSAAADDPDVSDWYALTWLWHNGTKFQQVFVIVNQAASEANPPPQPTPPSLARTVAAQALWVARQQADPSPEVDPVVITRARQLAHDLVTAATPP